MGNNTVRDSLLYSLLVATSIGFTSSSSNESVPVEIILERIERVSRDEVHFRLKVSNPSDRAVFLNGINYESGPRLDPVYLEQWRTKEGWKIVVPCMDTPPPHVIKLNPGEAMTFDLALELPVSAVCKVRDIRLEGRFRFRLEYFDNEKQARAYMRERFSDRWREARAPAAVSKEFEIPPSPNPE